MHIVAIKNVDDCFDKELMKEFELSDPITENIMKNMAEEATLKYYPEFPKPYYRIEKGGAYVIQGVIGNPTFKITYSVQATKETEQQLIDNILKGE